VSLSAVAIAAALGLGACSSDTEEKPAPATVATTPPMVPDQEVPAPPGAPLPPPTALSDVMNRLADSNVPGAEKTGLIESPVPGDAAALDKWGQALRQNGYDPVTFEARDLRWVQGAPDKISAVVSLKTENPQAGDFSYPMEFILTGNSWQLARRSADELLGEDAPQGSPSTTPPPPPAAPAPIPPATPPTPPR
jgi:hypothetical protein